jgi:8-oxo-dGTP pyrophosphatase MutT (NUDIX family)
MRTIKRDIVGAFIFSGDNKLLLGKTGVYKGEWVIPGGGINDNETKMQALRREMLEETGLDINDYKVEVVEGAISGQSEKKLRDTGEHVKVDMTFYNYVLRLPKPAAEIKVKTDDDFIDASWFTMEEIKRMPVSAPTITTLKKLGYL